MNVRGACHILYCLDLAQELDLVRAKERLFGWRQALFHHKSRVLTGDAVLPPLRVRFDAETIDLGAWSTASDVEVALYNVGTVAVTWTVPFDTELDDLVDLSSVLYDNPTMIEASARLARELLLSLGDAARDPKVAPQVEDYVTFEVAAELGELGEGARLSLARVLRAEPGALSEQEVRDALAEPVAYRVGEQLFIDWVGAFASGGVSEDERLVLELANVELLGLRVLDARLDAEIREAHAMVGRSLPMLGRGRRDLERLGQMQADAAIYFEGVDNALKLVSDDYLARVYRAAAARFHFEDLDRSIERKLGVLRGIHESLADRAGHRRSELLEWIIILLIMVDIIIYFVPWGA